MLSAGACGYLVKSADSSELLRALRSVANGHTHLSPEIAQMVVDAQRGKTTDWKPRSEQLSPHELKVLSLMAGGRTCPTIAAMLNVATSTVEAHRRNIMLKLGLHSIAELTKYAVRHGLTSD